MSSQITSDQDYKRWLTDIKNKIRTVQLQAAIRVNVELLNFYWELGAEIVAKQTFARWGEGFLSDLSKDLRAEFPEIKGFSLSNLKYIKQWYLFYHEGDLISQQAVGQIESWILGQITRIPWGHNIAIITKCNSIDEALYYVQHTLAHNWSRSVLVH